MKRRRFLPIQWSSQHLSFIHIQRGRAYYSSLDSQAIKFFPIVCSRLGAVVRDKDYSLS